MVKFIEVSRGLKKEKILLMCKSGLISYYRKYDFALRWKIKVGTWRFRMARNVFTAVKAIDISKTKRYGTDNKPEPLDS